MMRVATHIGFAGIGGHVGATGPTLSSAAMPLPPGVQKLRR